MDDKSKTYLKVDIARQFLSESRLSGLYRKYKGVDSGIITACRAEKTEHENQENYIKLKVILIGAKFSVTAVNGVFMKNYHSSAAKEVKAKFFIVFDYKNQDNLKEVLVKLGEKI